jgi:predicted RNase H-like HicB family nuclease
MCALSYPDSGQPGTSRFTVVLIPDVESGGYTVLVPALPGCVTDGETIDVAIANAKEAISLYIEGEDTGPLLARELVSQVVVAQVSVE